MTYKVYYTEDFGWIHAKGWRKVEAESAKEAREVFHTDRMSKHQVIRRVRKYDHK